MLTKAHSGGSGSSSGGSGCGDDGDNDKIFHVSAHVSVITSLFSCYST